MLIIQNSFENVLKHRHFNRVIFVY